MNETWKAVHQPYTEYGTIYSVEGTCFYADLIQLGKVGKVSLQDRKGGYLS